MNHSTRVEGIDKEVTPIPFGYHFHWAEFDALGNVIDGTKCCEICAKENDAFDSILKTKGDQQIMQKIMRKESFRNYDRKYPYDLASKAVSMDAIQDMIGQDAGEYHLDMESQQRVDEFKAGLTPRQLEVLELIEQGYKPREIAEMNERLTSNSDRWHKHIVKKKAQEFWGE